MGGEGEFLLRIGSLSDEKKVVGRVGWFRMAHRTCSPIRHVSTPSPTKKKAKANVAFHHKIGGRREGRSARAHLIEQGTRRPAHNQGIQGKVGGKDGHGCGMLGNANKQDAQDILGIQTRWIGHAGATAFHQRKLGRIPRLGRRK